MPTEVLSISPRPRAQERTGPTGGKSCCDATPGAPVNERSDGLVSRFDQTYYAYDYPALVHWASLREPSSAALLGPRARADPAAVRSMSSLGV